LVCANDTEQSRNAITWMMDNILVAGRDRVTVVTVLERVELQYFFTPDTAQILAEVQNAGLKASQRLANGAAETVKSRFPSLHVDVAILQGGTARDEIVDFVNAQIRMAQSETDPGANSESHVLVLGCRKLGALKRAFIGSTGDYCVHHADCPVLVVKMP